MEWNIADAADKLGLVAEKALHEERQRIQTDEGVVVVISQDELNRIEGKPKSLEEHPLNIPRASVEFPRDKSPMRDEDDTLGDHILRFPKIEEADFSRDRSPDREFEW